MGLASGQEAQHGRDATGGTDVTDPAGAVKRAPLSADDAIVGANQLRRRIPRGDEQGFTLTELIVAVFIIAIVMLSTLPGLYAAQTLSRTNLSRSAAASVAAQEMDYIRAQATTSFSTVVTPYGNRASLDHPGGETVGSTTYTIMWDSEPVGIGASTSACNGSTHAAPQVIQMTVTVSWPNMAGVAPVVSQTELAPPAGSYNPYNGAIAIKFINAGGTADANVVASVTPTSGGTATAYTTDTDGCAFFPNLTAGTYSLSATELGYVDDQGNQTVSIPSVTVTPGSVTIEPSHLYDQAARLSPFAVVGTVYGTSPAGVAPSGLQVTIANTGLSNGTKAVLPSGTPAAVPNLFPFGSGYNVWAGDCADANPAGKNAGGTPYYPGGVLPAAIGVIPGLATSVTLSTPTVAVTVTHGGTAVASAAVTLTATHAADPNSCISGDSLTLAATTSATGIVYIALPLGTWSVKVTGTGLNGTVAVPQLTPTTNALTSVSVAA